MAEEEKALPKLQATTPITGTICKNAPIKAVGDFTLQNSDFGCTFGANTSTVSLAYVTTFDDPEKPRVHVGPMLTGNKYQLVSRTGNGVRKGVYPSQGVLLIHRLGSITFNVCKDIDEALQELRSVFSACKLGATGYIELGETGASVDVVVDTVNEDLKLDFAVSAVDLRKQTNCTIFSKKFCDALKMPFPINEFKRRLKYSIAPKIMRQNVEGINNNYLRVSVGIESLITKFDALNL